MSSTYLKIPSILEILRGGREHVINYGFHLLEGLDRVLLYLP